MCQTDRVNDSFYDFFNQRFRCIDDHEHGTLYFANVAIGAHSLLTQVDPEFQCVLVVKESEIKAGITTPALLNRFEKYHLSHESMWEEALCYLTPGMRMIMNMVCNKVRKSSVHVIKPIDKKHSEEALTSRALNLNYCYCFR